jgi:hypothetical protein
LCNHSSTSSVWLHSRDLSYPKDYSAARPAFDAYPLARRSDRALCHRAGHEVTVVRDATADYSDEMMHASLEINLPNYASAVAPTEDNAPP